LFPPAPVGIAGHDTNQSTNQSINEHPFLVFSAQQASHHTRTGNAEKFEQAKLFDAMSDDRKVFCIVLDHVSPLSSSHSSLRMLLLHAGSI